MSEEKSKTPRSKALFWMLFPVGLLVVSVSGWLYMVSIAVDDPGFGVEPDYYKKASNFDDVIEQRKENNRLGWKAKVVAVSYMPTGKARVTLIVQGQDEEAVEGLTLSAEAFSVARSQAIVSLSFEEVKTGVFVADIDAPRPGLWELRLTMKDAAGALATQTLRPELPALAGTKRGGPPP